MAASGSSFQSFPLPNLGSLAPRFRNFSNLSLLLFILMTWTMVLDPPQMRPLKLVCWWCKKGFHSWHTCPLLGERSRPARKAKKAAQAMSHKGHHRGRACHLGWRLQTCPAHQRDCAKVAGVAVIVQCLNA